MNDERDTTEMDRLVSEAYRAAATENVPTHLSEKILQMAASEPAKQQQRSPYGIAASWLRPAAWVATISLSLAIVLEVTEDPAPEVPQSPVSTVAPTASRLEEATIEVNAADEKPRLNKMQAPAAMPAERKTAASDGRDIALDRNTLQESESLADTRVDANRQREVSGSLARAIEAAKKESDDADACNSESRETAELWIACIEILRETGRTAEAASEYDELARKFPDFTPHK